MQIQCEKSGQKIGFEKLIGFDWTWLQSKSALRTHFGKQLPQAMVSINERKTLSIFYLNSHHSDHVIDHDVIASTLWSNTQAIVLPHCISDLLHSDKVCSFNALSKEE